MAPAGEVNGCFSVVVVRCWIVGGRCESQGVAFVYNRESQWHLSQGGAGEQKMEVNLRERKEFCGVQLGFQGLGLRPSVVAGLKPAQTRQGRGCFGMTQQAFLCQQKRNAQDSETAENVRFWVRQFHGADKRMVLSLLRYALQSCYVLAKACSRLNSHLYKHPSTYARPGTHKLHIDA